MIERIEPGSVGYEMWHADHIARYLFACQYVAGKHVLDAGTGVGYGATILKAEGASSVQAVDISEEALDYARKHFGDSGVDYILGDCENLDEVSGPIEVICNFENIEHLQKPEAFLAAAVRLLSPKGVLICSAPDPAESSTRLESGALKNPYHVQEWARTEFEAMLRKYFVDVDVRAQVVALAWHSRKRGLDALNSRLTTLRASPGACLVRLLKRLLGRGSDWWNGMERLIAPSVLEFPIYPASYAALVGTPHCHVAICREPKLT